MKCKKDFIIINNNYKNEKNDLNSLNIKVNKSSSFKNVKDKLEDIKIRTKNLLEFYSSNKRENINNINFTSNNISIDHENNKENE